MAIAIPIFTNQLEKSKEATDASNIRGYYAEIATAITTDELDISQTGKTLTLSASGNNAATAVTAKIQTAYSASEGTFVVRVSNVKVSQSMDNWQSGSQEVAGYQIAEDNNMVGTTNIDFTFTVTEDNDTTASSTVLTAIAFS